MNIESLYIKTYHDFVSHKMKLRNQRAIFGDNSMRTIGLV
jgi:hypothetical protein